MKRLFQGRCVITPGRRVDEHPVRTAVVLVVLPVVLVLGAGTSFEGDAGGLGGRWPWRAAAIWLLIVLASVVHQLARLTRAWNTRVDVDTLIAKEQGQVPASQAVRELDNGRSQQGTAVGTRAGGMVFVPHDSHIIRSYKPEDITVLDQQPGRSITVEAPGLGRPLGPRVDRITILPERWQRTDWDRLGDVSDEASI